MSVWDSNNRIALSDNLVLKVMHAHTRAEVITGFAVSINFSSYVAVRNYMEGYWGIIEEMEVDGRGHETG